MHPSQQMTDMPSCDQCQHERLNVQYNCRARLVAGGLHAGFCALSAAQCLMSHFSHMYCA